MISPSLLTEPIGLVTPTHTEDDYGQTEVWPDEPVVVRGRLQHSTGTETFDNRDAVVSGWKLFLPVHFGVDEDGRPVPTPIDGYSRVRAQGIEFSVVGRPKVARGFGGRPSHIEAQLEEVEG